jgi:GNAT superfamily N-acetyltransferase
MQLEPMTIEVAAVAGAQVVEHGTIPIAFEVRSRLQATQNSTNSFLLTEHPVNPSYVKDYDLVSEPPRDWASRFDTSQWAMFLARVNGGAIGGATVACRSVDLEMLDGRTDLAVLWDLRVMPTFRRQRIGRGLFDAVAAWAVAQGCRELKVETQNVNVAACRFYAALGCTLLGVREEAYPECPGEAQFLWYKSLSVSVGADDHASDAVSAGHDWLKVREQDSSG